MRWGYLNAFVVLGLTLITGGAARASDEAVIVLHVYDAANVSQYLLEAEKEVERVYSAIGVHTIWVDKHEPFSDSGHREHLAIYIQSIQNVDMRDVPSKELGVAPRGEELRGHIAFVFFDRVKEIARLTPLFTGRVLAMVMAHEVGHLLLPYGSHSDHGIMVGTWDPQQIRRAALSELAFTREQGDLIRRQLSDDMAQAAQLANNAER